MGNPAEIFNPVNSVAPGAGAIANSILNSKGGNSIKPPLPTAPTQTSNLFDLYAETLPMSWSQSSPINDPSSILNAYINNIPAINRAANNTNTDIANSQAYKMAYKNATGKLPAGYIGYA